MPKGNVLYIDVATVKLQHLARLQRLNSFSCLFTQGDADICGQSDQENAQMLTWGESYSYSCGWTDAILSEATGAYRIWVPLSDAHGKGEAVIMCTDVWALLSPPLSHMEEKSVMNTPSILQWRCTVLIHTHDQMKQHDFVFTMVSTLLKLYGTLNSQWDHLFVWKSYAAVWSDQTVGLLKQWLRLLAWLPVCLFVSSLHQKKPMMYLQCTWIILFKHRL